MRARERHGKARVEKMDVGKVRVGRRDAADYKDADSQRLMQYQTRTV